MISVSAGVGTCIGIVMASYIHVIINRAKNRGPASSRAFYGRAVKKMWTQMILLCTSGVVQVVAVGVFTVTQAGERTPDMLYATL
eukprot:g17894.t1